jgi:ribosome-associated toxin RatA of RatAB toxin-antitoxin module
MPRIAVQCEITAPAAGLFALSQDYELRRAWDPFTRRIEFLDGAPAAGLGVRARGTSWHGMTMVVEYIAFDPPVHAAMKMVRGPWFYSHFAGTWRFRQQSAENTRVEFIYTYKLRWPALSWLIAGIVHRVFARDVRRRLAGLKRGAETGRLVERLAVRE